MVIWDYFVQYYIYWTLPSMPVTEATFFIGLIVIFNKIQPKAACIGKLIVHFFVLFVSVVIAKALLRLTAFNMTYIYLIFAAVYAAIFGRKKPVNSIIYLCVYWTVYVFSTVFGKAVGAVIFEHILNIEYSRAATYASIAVTTLVMLTFFTAFIKIFSLERYAQIGKPYILFPLAVDIIANIAKVLVDSVKGEGLPFFNLNEKESALFIFLCGILLYLLNGLSYWFCFRQTKAIAQNEEISEEIRAIRRERKDGRESAEIFKSSLEEMRQIKHDIKNQLAYLQIMIEAKDYAKMEEYFGELNQNVYNALNYSDCENTTVRNVLNLEKYKSGQYGITLDAKIIVPARIEGISEYDLTTILLNLLDNAIEACVEDGCVSPVIECNMRLKDRYLYINIVNPVADAGKKARRKKLETGKTEKELHGRGTKIVKAIVGRYKGAFTHEIEDNKFTADVMLALADAKEGI